MADGTATLTLAGTGLLVLTLCWPGSPAAREPLSQPRDQAPSSPPLVEVQPATVLLEEGGLVLEEQRWSFGEASGRAWRVRVPLPGSASVSPSDTVQPFSELLPKDPGPWAAINGGFYERGPMGLVVSRGVEKSALSPRGGSGIFQWSATAGPEVVHRSAWIPGPSEAVQSIDRLVDDGRSLVRRREYARSAARSAVVISQDALWLVALADEDSVQELPDGAGVQLRDTVALGLPLWAFADYLVRELGARTALNLDGAISTQLAVQTPSTGFELRGERGTINAVIIRP